MANRNGFEAKSKKIPLTETKTKQAKWFSAVNGAAGSASLLQAHRIQVSRKLPKITGAEQKVLALVAQARTNKEIALDLGISPATVKRHMEKILKKLKLRNRVEAAICGLLLNGCPHESNSGCILRELQAGGKEPLSWGIDP